MGKISLNGIELIGKIGVYKQEHAIGTKCLIDIELTAPLKKSGESDELADALDYEVVLAAVKKCMQNQYYLMEAAARAIGVELIELFPDVSAIKIHVHKIKPLLEANVKEVVVEWNYPEDF